MPEDDYTHLIEQADAIRKIVSITLWSETIKLGIEVAPVWFEDEFIVQPYAVTRNNKREQWNI